MKKLLIADDHPFIHRFYALALQELPVRCWFAADGREAVRIAAEVEPDLILMDYSMPVLDGEKAALEIRRIRSLQFARILLLTAAPPSVARKLSGFDGYLTKPIRAEELVQTVCEKLEIDLPAWTVVPGKIASQKVG